MPKFNLLVETGNFDEGLGYYGGRRQTLGTYKTQKEAFDAAKKIGRESLNIPLSAGYTFLIVEQEGKNILRELVKHHTHPYNMTDEQRRAAKKARLKAQQYQSVTVCGTPTEGQVYYFENGIMVNEQETSMVISLSRVPGIMRAERPPQDGEKRALRGMVARVGNEYFAKYYDETPWESKESSD